MSTTTTDRIRLSGLSARGYHGVLPHERTEGQIFSVDVSVDLGERGTAVAAVTDSLTDAADYSAIARAVVAIIEGEPVNLIETLAGRIGDAVLAFPRVAAVEVTVHKPQAPLDVAFDDVSVTIRRTGDEAPSSQGPAAVPGVQADAQPWQPQAAPAQQTPLAAVGLAEAAPASDPGGWTPQGAEDYSGGFANQGAPGGDAGFGGEAPGQWAGDSIGQGGQPDQGYVGGGFPDAAVSGADVLTQRPAAAAGIVVALGGNVGGVVPALRGAVRTLKETDGIEVTAVAPLARTAPVVDPGTPEQPDFLNTVVLATTILSPREVLDVCRGLEADAGRVRTEPNGPRTLDADLVDYEGVTSSDDPELVLPHPRAHQRAFVLVPWSQADPFAEIGDQYVATLAESAPDRDGVRWLALDWLDSDHLPALPTGQYVAPPDADSAAAGGESPAGEGGAEADGFADASGAPAGSAGSAGTALSAGSAGSAARLIDSVPGGEANFGGVDDGAGMPGASPDQAAGGGVDPYGYAQDAGLQPGGGFQPQDGGYAQADGGFQPDGGYAQADGGFQPEGGYAQADGGYPQQNLGFQAQDQEEDSWNAPAWNDVVRRDDGQGF